MPATIHPPAQHDTPGRASAVMVRHAEPADLDALVDLEERSFSADRMSRAQYRRHLHSASAQVFVASDGDHPLLGSAVLFFRAGSTQARLYSLATRPDARGRGVATALVQAAANAARERGCHALRLEVRADNATAIRLYERWGFRRIGGYQHYYQDDADAWRYELMLD